MLWSCILTILPFVFLGIGIWFLKTKKEWWDIKEPLGFTFSIIGGIGILLILITIPIGRMDVTSQIQQFQAVQTTIEIQRKTGNDMERAATILTIAEMNRWLASAKYYSEIFSFWYPRELRELNPIK